MSFVNGQSGTNKRKNSQSAESLLLNDTDSYGGSRKKQEGVQQQASEKVEAEIEGVEEAPAKKRYAMDKNWRDANDNSMSRVRSAVTQMLISLDPWKKAQQPFQDALELEQPLRLWHRLQIPGFLAFYGVACYLAGLFSYGYLLLALLYLGQFVFSRRLQKFKRSLSVQVYRDEVQKAQLAQSTIGDDFSESVEWINLILARVWGVFEPTLSASIVEQVNLVLADNTPSFIQSINLVELTLGSEPPALVGAKAFPQTETDVIVAATNEAAGDGSDVRASRNL
jgi:Ca2+-dependent lipid-binding protein